MVVDDDNENNKNVVNRFIVSPKNQTNNGIIENFNQNINRNFGQNFSENGDKNSGHCHHNGNDSSQVNNHISTISSPDNFGVSTINGTCSNERSTSQKHFQFSPERNMKCENENEYENGGRNENNIKNNGEYENDNVNDDEDDVVSNGNGNGHKYLEHTEDHDFRNKRAAHYNEYKLGTCACTDLSYSIFLNVSNLRKLLLMFSVNFILTLILPHIYIYFFLIPSFPFFSFLLLFITF